MFFALLFAMLTTARADDCPGAGAEAAIDASARGTAVLDALLGPGAGRVVAVERVAVVETRAEFEDPGGSDPGALPGDSRLEPGASAARRFPPATRRILSSRGVTVKSVDATLYLPEEVDGAREKILAEAVAKELDMDMARGDRERIVRIARARLPARSTAGGQAELRAFALAAVLGAVGLFAIAWSIARAARPASAPARAIVLLPELERAALPGTSDDGTDGGLP